MKLPGTGGARQPQKKKTGMLPPPEGGDFGAFLKLDHLQGADHAVLLFTGDVKIDPKPRFGDQVLATVKLGKEEYTWGIRTKSSNYRKLLERFGNNPKNWKGKVPIEVAEFNGNEFIAVK
jgi:hypothetical protein